MTINKAFLGIDLDLVNNPKYKELSFLAKGLYALYADRSTYSEYNTANGEVCFADEYGVYIYYTNEQAGDILGVTPRTISKLRKELASAELIEVRRQGLVGYKIYVKQVEQTPKNINWKMSWKKNIDLNTEDNSTVLEEDSHVQENISSTTGKITSLSGSAKSITTSETRETGKTEQSSDIAPVSKSREDIALEGLGDRVSAVMGIRTWSKISMIAQGSYNTAKNLVDTIYKAKKQLFKRVRGTILHEFAEVPEIYDVAYDSLHFENNSLLSSGLESVLIRIIEIHYKSEKSEITNLGGFVYSFVRNSLASSVKLFMEEHAGEHFTDDMRSYIHKSLMF